MLPTIGNLGAILFNNVELIQNIWSDLFGKKFQDLWCDPETSIKEVIDFARDTIEKSTGLQKGASHATLFMRDPLTDRLILEYSTKNELNKGSRPPSDRLFRNKRENYNGDNEECFYNLCDSLLNDNDKKSDISRETRGLTGWVTVTGIPLVINSSRSKEILEDMIKENLLAEQACETYGYPKWGHRIYEFPFPDNTKEWSKRFMAVPIKSIIDTSKTIGVVRYSCPLKCRELAQLDLLFLQSIAELISVLKNIKQVKILCNRDSDLQKECLDFKQTGDFSKFLESVAYCLRSRISSLYIAINVHGTTILRLVDAFGISGYTGNLREDIKDYSYKEGGLTYELLECRDLEPRVYNSVVKSQKWRGRNTKLFYGKTLSELCINDIGGKLDNETYQRELLSRHPIKLMGCGLSEKEIPVGVIKVEFPKIYDDSQHYNASDEKFFVECARFLKRELICYQKFINGEWFKDTNSEKADEFIKFMSQIFRYKLIKSEDNLDEFWKNAQDYANNFSKEIRAANIKRLNERTETNGSHLLMLKELNKIEKNNIRWGWMRDIFISEGIKQMVEKSFGLGETLFK